jgi:hypothetical protein
MSATLILQNTEKRSLDRKVELVRPVLAGRTLPVALDHQIQN